MYILGLSSRVSVRSGLFNHRAAWCLVPPKCHLSKKITGQFFEGTRQQRRNQSVEPWIHVIPFLESKQVLEYPVTTFWWHLSFANCSIVFRFPSRAWLSASFLHIYRLWPLSSIIRLGNCCWTPYRTSYCQRLPLAMAGKPLVATWPLKDVSWDILTSQRFSLTLLPR